MERGGDQRTRIYYFGDHDPSGTDMDRNIVAGIGEVLSHLGHGGKHGYLVNTRDLCRHNPVTGIAFTAQNGKALTKQVRVKTACSSRAKKHRKRHRSSR